MLQSNLWLEGFERSRPMVLVMKCFGTQSSSPYQHAIPPLEWKEEKDDYSTQWRGSSLNCYSILPQSSLDTKTRIGLRNGPLEDEKK